MPNITENPNQRPVVETIDNQPATFNVSTDQTTNIIWYLDNKQVQTNNTIAPGAMATYVVSAAKGNHNVSVIATNTSTFSSSSVYWNLSVLSTTYHSQPTA